MEKNEFIKQLSTMSRKDIENHFKQSCVRTKKIYPLIILSKEELIKQKLSKET